MNRTWPAGMVLLTAILATAGCKSAVREDPILQLSAQEALAQGKDLLAQEKHEKARPYFEHAYSVEPNSAVGREGLLLAADTYFQEGGYTNFVQAEAKYRDFINRFPTSEQAAYVQFQVANSLARRMEKPDRDQAVTRKSLQAYEDLLRLYPTSEYAAQAKEQISKVRQNLAAHEFIVGRFYLRYGAPTSALKRFEYLIEHFPDYAARDEVFYFIGLAHNRLGQKEEAQKAFERLRTDYPESSYLREIPAQEAAR